MYAGFPVVHHKIIRFLGCSTKPRRFIGLATKPTWSRCKVAAESSEAWRGEAGPCMRGLMVLPQNHPVAGFPGLGLKTRCRGPNVTVC